MEVPGKGPARRDSDPRDFLGIDRLLSAEEHALRRRVREYVAAQITPEIEAWFEAAHWPQAVAGELGTLGLLGMHLEGYGCGGRSAVEYGLACLELEAADSGLRSLMSVQSSLVMFPIWKFGNDEQKRKWLPGMAAGEIIGCFGLTEPQSGSDPSSMRTAATKDGDGWVLNGRKRWSTNGGIAQVALVWARTDEGVRGFLVPRDAPGFEVRNIEHKLSLRASVSSELLLEDCRVGPGSMLPGVTGMRGPLSCLHEARYGIVWGAMGAARSCFECALQHSKSRHQFGKPIGSFQLIQQKLVDMLVELDKGMLLALHLGRLKDEGLLDSPQVSMGKLNNVREALAIARAARSILGADGITLEYPVIRHMNNLESVLTYEGTSEIHTLIVGEAITGLRAFSSSSSSPSSSF